MRGTRRSASVVRPRDKAKVSQEDRRARKSKKERKEIEYSPDRSIQAVQAIQHVEPPENNDRKLERRMSSSGHHRSPRKSERPPSSHGNKSYSHPQLSAQSSPPRRDDQSYYGIPQRSPSRSATATPQSIPHRPRPQTAQTYPDPRPLSYHSNSTMNSGGGYRPAPPLSASAYYQQQQQQQPQQYTTPSYQPSTPNYARYALTPGPAQDSYFTPQATSRPLASRFDSLTNPAMTRVQHSYDPVTRTTSAFGTRDTSSRSIVESSYDDEYHDGYNDDDYNSAVEAPVSRPKKKDRRSSLRAPPPPSALSKAEADYRAMPPPPSLPPAIRPGILRNRAQTEYVLEPRDTVAYRKARSQFTDQELEDEVPRRPRRPSANRHSVSYDLGSGAESVRIESANSSRRRESWYDQSQTTSGSSGYEDKIRDAASYQEDMSGPPALPLTADMLRKAQRRQGGSSRSTKSSGSRDESDYKKSATTRTTRSGSNNDDENVTIKVTGGARVMIGGAQIDCTEGGQIEIKRNTSLRDGSVRSSSEYGGRTEFGRIEDRRRGIEARPQTRSRVGSHSGGGGRSYTRTSPVYPMDNQF